MNAIQRIERKLWTIKKKSLPPCKKDWPLKMLIKYDMFLYKQKMGYTFDFQHPILFTEKIQRYKLLYDRPEFPDIVDKYLFKDYIKDKLGEGNTIPLYGVWTTIDDLRRDWNRLPNAIVLKSNLQGEGKCIRIIKDKSSIDFEDLAKELESWLDPLNTAINTLLHAYHRGTPRILAEEYKAQINGQLYDYKVFCFNGKPHCCYVATDHFPGQLSHISFYDLEWNRLNVRYGDHPNCDVDKPVHFDEMLQKAKKLSENFPFVRVDFFEADGHVFVAEMTMYPGAGQIPYHPESFNRELGDLFVLPESEMIRNG